MALPDAAVAYYLAMQRLQLATMGAVRAAWKRMGDDFDAGWSGVGANNGVGRDVKTLVSAGQLVAAQQGAAMVPAALAQQGIHTPASGQVVPRAFSGVASDGRDLAGLLYSAVTHAKTAVGAGAQPAAALALGGRFLDMATRTQVVDAGRAAASVVTTVTPSVGYIRVVNPPCCDRCAILAGRWYRWSAGFARHPHQSHDAIVLMSLRAKIPPTISAPVPSASSVRVTCRDCPRLTRRRYRMAPTQPR